VATFVLVVTGLLVAGPAHSGLHGASDGHGCEACAIQGASPDASPPVLGPPRLAGIAIDLRPAALSPARPPSLPPARGPPRSA